MYVVVSKLHEHFSVWELTVCAGCVLKIVQSIYDFLSRRDKERRKQINHKNAFLRNLGMPL